jgi:hypothetical protein
MIYTNGVAVVFLSSHPQAHARGQTARHLLVVDELQDQDPAHLQAARVYGGTNRPARPMEQTELFVKAIRHRRRRNMFVLPPDSTQAIALRTLAVPATR